jgi:hypothetical protein
LLLADDNLLPYILSAASLYYNYLTRNLQMNTFNIAFDSLDRKLNAKIDVSGMRDYHNYEVSISEDISPLAQQFTFTLFKKDLSCSFAARSVLSAAIAKSAWKMIAMRERLVGTVTPATMI